VERKTVGVAGFRLRVAQNSSRRRDRITVVTDAESSSAAAAARRLAPCSRDVHPD